MDLFSLNSFDLPFRSHCGGGSGISSASVTASSTIAVPLLRPLSRVMDGGGRMLSTEQTVMLERQFVECSKPNAQTRRALSEKTGLSIPYIATWFHSRREKAQQQISKPVDSTSHDSAGRRRESSRPAESDTNMIAVRPPPRRAVSSAAAFACPSKPSRLFDHTPFASPTEADFATPATSLAAAATAVVQCSNDVTDTNLPSNMATAGIDAPTSPWPVSAFSDYGSSTCSTAACTPFADIDAADPFSDDEIRSDVEDDYFNTPPPSNNYEEFAAAIRARPTNFVLASLPPPPPSRPAEAVRQRRPTLKPLTLECRVSSFDEASKRQSQLLSPPTPAASPGTEGAPLTHEQHASPPHTPMEMMETKPNAPSIFGASTFGRGAGAPERVVEREPFSFEPVLESPTLFIGPMI